MIYKNKSELYNLRHSKEYRKAYMIVCIIVPLFSVIISNTILNIFHIKNILISVLLCSLVLLLIYYTDYQNLKENIKILNEIK